MPVQEKESSGKKVYFVFLVILAASIFIYELGMLLWYILAEDAIGFLSIGMPTLLDWILALTGFIGSIVLFLAGINYLRRQSWYSTFKWACSIFIANNILNIIATVISVNSEIGYYDGSGWGMYSAFSVAVDIFAIIFWGFNSWIIKE
ncbi:MAG: hypothetical protein Q7R56_00290 [Nanoarchaeota archaeon]|nr:hypothetical protein [Nanoarchaeota archaeon]